MIERAAKLHREADFLMGELRLLELLGLNGQVQPGGSYYLDVMVYPDLDVYFSMVSIPRLFQIAGNLAQHPWVYQVVFEKSDDPTLPGGLYLKPRIRYGKWGRPWKMDLWSLDDAVIKQKMAEMRRWKEQMTPGQRQRILEYKLSVLTAEQRTPMYSGYWIYKAILDEGLVEPAAISQFLVSQGVKLS